MDYVKTPVKKAKKDDFTKKEMEQIFGKVEEEFIKSFNFEEASTLELIFTVVKRHRVFLISLLGLVGWIWAIFV